MASLADWNDTFGQAERRREHVAETEGLGATAGDACYGCGRIDARTRAGGLLCLDCLDGGGPCRIGHCYQEAVADVETIPSRQLVPLCRDHARQAERLKRTVIYR